MIKKAISLLLLIVAVYWSFLAMMPQSISNLNTDENQFSTQRALVHLKELTKAPHFVGSEEHENVRNYIVNELNQLGLKAKIQEGYSLRDWGNLSKPKNIIAKIEGSNNSKALLLLSHYDSAPQASLGASDAGSGVVTILEGVRAFLANGTQPKNDIIIVITDAEELGLNGADIFVNRHPWAKDVGLVLNFEARGSGGPSYMLMETNAGNANLMKGFVEANPQYPVANSLAYSIYKMLPNDTDLTVFREDGDIEGFNFAFIGDHFDYHTYMDNYERLDRNTLEHQASYLMPLLSYFSEADLSNLKTDVDYIYFNVPLFKVVMYPFSWIWPMLILALVLFGGLIAYGIKKERLNVKLMLKGFVPFLVALITSVLVCYLLWELMLVLYPEYSEMLHGFTYNGYTYILAFAFVTLSLCFWAYNKFKQESVANTLIAPITIWLVVCLFVAMYLKGASFFIVPVFFALIALYVTIKQNEPNLYLLALLCFPLLLIFTPFIKMFPVGLGLKMLISVGALGALIFGLLLPVLGFLNHKKRWSRISFMVALIVLIVAHFNASFNEEQPKPNSLVYVLNADNNTANWATYDSMLDTWTKNFITEETDVNSNENTFSSKYNSRFTYTAEATIKHIPDSKVTISKDTIIGDLRHIEMSIVQQRSINKFDLYAKSEVKFKDFKVNGVEAYKETADGFAFEMRRGNRLFSYFVSDNDSLHLDFTVPKNQKTQIQLYESSFDLLTNELFTIPKRTKEMIPKPFILNDAIIVTKTIDIN
ncbi:M28 family peptidase [Pontimicrobium aquaticum]|uniref:M20/M25/M40 family metallo-hydrolase n=1 Tax=Pontimicrobium aquaticum TaxID=2565367 RepID=A0A4U0F007_9FLAO|nr:M28 family peptidase [Pontimicrobium aquaticum]TJY37705.1 M20/M25/M40 family metallo-hydrolase [Pontimicrobium aquaticum]